MTIAITTFNTEQKINAGNFQIALSGWGADYLDAENFYQLLYGPNKPPSYNDSSYANSEYDRLYEQMKTMPPGAERNKLITRMATIIKEDVPVILLYNRINLQLSQKWVKNRKEEGSRYRFKFLDIDVSSKAKGLKP